MKLFDLTGKVAIVTGGNGGIGRLMALWLAESVGARLALLSRSAKPDASLTAEIEEVSGDSAKLRQQIRDTRRV